MMIKTKLSILLLIGIILSQLVFSQEYQQKEIVDEINDILDEYPSSSSSFGVETVVLYSVELTYREVILREESRTSYDTRIKEYFLTYTDIQVNSLQIDSESDFLSISYSNYGGSYNYIKYRETGSGNFSEGQELTINLYLDLISTSDNHRLVSLFNTLFSNISGNHYTYSGSANQSTGNDDYYKYYSEPEVYDYGDDSYFSQEGDETDDFNYYSDYDYNSNNDYFEEAEIEYYTEDGIRVYSESEAYYYRTIDYDEDGILTVIDFIGRETPYMVAQIKYRDPENRNNDVYDGKSIWFYENGDIHFIAFYEDGILMDNEYVEVDEQGVATLIYSDDFSDNRNNWRLGDETDINAAIESGFLYVESKNNYIIPILIKYKIEQDVNFILESKFKLLHGDNNSGQGIIWGFKDWDNYFSFRISNDGYYEIVAYNDGLRFDLSDKWVKSNYIRQNNGWNKLQLNKYDDKILFSINGHLVEKHDFYSFKGNYIGFAVGPNRKIKVENITIKQNLGNINDDSPRGGDGEGEDFAGNGTGFFIDRAGYIATNYHVVESAKVIVIEFIRNGETLNYNAKVVQTDKQNDLAIIKIKDSDFIPFASIPYNFKTETSDVGTNVFALGYPWALTGMGTEIKFTDGKLSSKTGFRGDVTTYQMTTPVQGGNSGGPLFDYDGNLIGINASKLESEEIDNVSYAIKSSYLSNLVDALPIYIYLPDDTSIADETLTEKIKILSPYVVLIKIK